MRSLFRIAKADTAAIFGRYTAVFALMAILPVAATAHAFQQAEVIGTSESALSAIDIWASFFGGSQPFQLQDEKAFILPAGWMLTQLTLLLSIGFHTSQELRATAAHALPRTGSTLKWWMSKFISALTIVVLFYLWCAFVFSTASLLFGSSIFEFHAERAFPGESNLAPPSDSAKPYALILSALIPPLCSFALCLTQISLSLIISSELSLGATLGYMVISIYLPSTFLLGDSGMLLRIDALVAGCYPGHQIVLLNLTWIAALTVCGAFVLSKKDFIEQSKD